MDIIVLQRAARAGRLFFESSSHSTFLFEHDLRANASRLSRGKPVPTFPDHALGVGFQEVVHLVRTEEAEVTKLQCSTERPDEQPQECSPDAERSRGDGAVCRSGT